MLHYYYLDVQSFETRVAPLDLCILDAQSWAYIYQTLQKI